jgi:hypothetical protein
MLKLAAHVATENGKSLHSVLSEIHLYDKATGLDGQNRAPELTVS